MKRTTIFLDESLERRLKHKARREGKSFAQCVREAVAAYVAAPTGKRPLPSWVGMWDSGYADTSERVDEILSETLGKKDPHS
jgi:predicted transcriptional regulator